MGATRPASGKCKSLYTKQRLTDSTNYTSVCEPLSQIPTRDASPPLEVAFGDSVSGSVWCLRLMLETVRTLRL